MRLATHILQVDDQLAETILSHTHIEKKIGIYLSAACVSSALYGVAFGIWRSPLQACYSAVKMPLLFLSTIAVSGTANAMLSLVLGVGLSFRQVVLCIAKSMAVTAVLLGALSPVSLFFSMQSPTTSAAYPWVLAGHTGIVGICGTVGIAHLRGLLRSLTAAPYRALAAWFVITGFVGAQLSWILSPFLALPDYPEPFFNPAAFSGNVYEYLWHTLTGVL